MTEIHIQNYTEKSFVVLGDTKPHKDNIKKLGGKWNSRLRDNKMGWIFPMSKKESVEEYISDFHKTGEIKQIQGTTGNFQRTDLSDILKRLERLEMEVKQLRMEKETSSKDDSKDESENDFEEKPKRRLLRKV
jgi:hypothetical protein